MLLSRKIRDYGAKYRGKEIKMSTEINSFLNLRNTIEMRIGAYSVTWSNLFYFYGFS